MLSIRTATVADADEIVRLTQQLGYEVDGATFPGRLRRILARPDSQLWMAEGHGRAAGWLHAAVWEDIEAEPFVVIGGLVVDREHRKLGIGRALLAEAERWATTRGCSVVRLWSSATRTEAHRFYERVGYTRLKTQYAFAKSVDPARAIDLTSFVPRSPE